MYIFFSHSRRVPCGRDNTVPTRGSVQFGLSLKLDNSNCGKSRREGDCIQQSIHYNLSLSWYIKIKKQSNNNRRRIKRCQGYTAFFHGRCAAISQLHSWLPTTPHATEQKIQQVKKRRNALAPAAPDIQKFVSGKHNLIVLWLEKILCNFLIEYFTINIFSSCKTRRTSIYIFQQ